MPDDDSLRAWWPHPWSPDLDPFVNPPDLGAALLEGDLNLARPAANALVYGLTALVTFLEGEAAPDVIDELAPLAARECPPDGGDELLLALLEFSATMRRRSRAGFWHTIRQVEPALAATRPGRPARVGRLVEASMTAAVAAAAQQVAAVTAASPPLRPGLELVEGYLCAEFPPDGTVRDWPCRQVAPTPRAWPGPSGDAIRRWFEGAPSGAVRRWLGVELAGFDNLAALAEIEGEFAAAAAACLAAGSPVSGRAESAPLPAPAGHLGAEARAICNLIAHPEWTNQQIAEAAGCHVKHLSRLPLFKRIREGQRELGRADAPRGRKGADGTLEAWE